MIVIDMDMPKNCEECEIEYSIDNDYGDEICYVCPCIYKGYTDEVRKEGKLSNCPIKCDIDDIKAEIKSVKQYKGRSGNFFP